MNWESHREEFGQDWLAWAQRGLVDYVCPMNYTTNPQRFELYVSRQEKWLAGLGTYVSGIGIYADGFDFQGPQQALDQIKVAREHGSKGFVIFNYNEALVRDYLPSLAQTVTPESATAQRDPDGGP